MSAIDDKYAQLAAVDINLGAPKGPEVTCTNKNWKKRDYQYGSIYWDQGAQKTYEVHGAIAQKYYSLQAETGFLSFPWSDETILPDGFGRANYFDGGAIYWRPSVGAFEVHGAIGGRYGQIGGSQSVLGYPLSDESPTTDNTGSRWNQFQFGVIFWKNGSGAAYEVHGAILAKWNSLGSYKSSLGYPVTNEIPVPNPSGARQSKFEHGTIVWTPAGGAQVI